MSEGRGVVADGDQDGSPVALADGGGQTLGRRVGGWSGSVGEVERRACRGGLGGGSNLFRYPRSVAGAEADNEALVLRRRLHVHAAWEEKVAELPVNEATEKQEENERQADVQDGKIRVRQKKRLLPPGDPVVKRQNEPGQGDPGGQGVPERLAVPARIGNVGECPVDGGTGNGGGLLSWRLFRLRSSARRFRNSGRGKRGSRASSASSLKEAIFRKFQGRLPKSSHAPKNLRIEANFSQKAEKEGGKVNQWGEFFVVKCRSEVWQ